MARLNTDAEAFRHAGVVQFELDEWIETAPFEDLLDLRIVQTVKGGAVLSMPFKVKHCQGGGLLHGGAMTTLADTAVAMAIKTLLPQGTRFATVALRMEFVAPVSEGEVTARAEVHRSDARTFQGEAVIFDQNNSTVARFFSTFKVARSGIDAPVTDRP